jgi:hypothetical protein
MKVQQAKQNKGTTESSILLIILVKEDKGDKGREKVNEIIDGKPQNFLTNCKNCN